MTQKVDMNLILRVGIKYDAEAKVHVSYCPDLDIHSQGTTHQRALRAMEDAIKAYMFAAHKAGILDEVIDKVQKSARSEHALAVLKREEYRAQYLPTTAPFLRPAYA